MMKTYQMTGADQCVARAGNQLPPIPAKVAPIKAARPTGQRNCAELGVCQALNPPCGHCDKAETLTPFEQIAYWITVAALSGLTIGVSIGVGRWVYYGWLAA